MDLQTLSQQAFAAHRGGNLTLAEKLYRQILRADENNFVALHMLGFLKGQTGQYHEAARLIAKALVAKPDDIEALTNYAHALLAAKRPQEALGAYDRVLALRPDCVEALYNRGVILSQQKCPSEALECFDRALAMRPDAAGTLYNRAVVLAELNRFEDALANYDRALQLQPNLSMAASNRAMLVLNMCAWERVAETTQEITQMIKAGLSIPPLTLLGYSDDKRVQLQCAQNAIRAIVPSLPAPLWNGKQRAHDKIRLGYVSSDFREHAVWIQLAQLIERHDRSQFDVIGISTRPTDNTEIGARVTKAFDEFHDVSSKSDAEVARELNRLEIDIAIDLNGHTSGARTAAFAYRPCPIQVAWLGYPGTMGADFYDYLIADRIVVPPAHQEFFTENLLYLDNSYLPSDSTRIVKAAPSRAQLGIPEDAFVFCCFNSSWKITEPIFSLWMRLLCLVPESVLWLKNTNEAATRNLVRRTKLLGVEPKRVIFADDVPIDVHLSRQRRADLFLDTAPYNAHATASDALWAGLPVLTYLGASFAGRVGASLLHAAGLTELVVESLEEYEALALDLAQHPQKFEGIRQKLAGSRLQHPLFDSERFRQNIETAFTEIWRKSRRGEAACTLAIGNRGSLEESQ